MERREELLRLARRAKVRAHAPYSGFRVGAALLVEDGSVFTGCNVENASYGLTLCAERGAVSAAVAEGHTRFRGVALSTDGPHPVPPCGACRQVLAEFAPGLPVVSECDAGAAVWSLDELLPVPFALRVETGAGAAGDGASGDGAEERVGPARIDSQTDTD